MIFDVEDVEKVSTFGFITLFVEGEQKLFALTFSTVAPLIHILHVWDMQKSCLLGNFL